MTDDTAIAELARKLLAGSGRQHAETMPERTPEPDWCPACLHDLDGPLRPWPLPNEWGDTGELVCGRCWLARVRGDVTCQLLCGELVVWTTHPQRGQVLRGAIRAVGIVPGGLQPAIRWQLTGPRQDQPLGEYVGDFVDAQARLLDATADRDQIDSEEDRP